MEDPREEEEEQGTVDLASVLYVVGGIPFMIVFFVALFWAVGAFDERGIYLPF